MCFEDSLAGGGMPAPPQSGIDLRERSPLALAFVGDGVLELMARARLVARSRMPVGALHRESVRIVSAKAQFAALGRVLPALTPQEADVLRRGRNADKSAAPKNTGREAYHASTGLEALFGWLYLQGRTRRAEELFELIWRHYLDETDGSCQNPARAAD